MTIVDEGPQTDPTSDRRRPWWLGPALVGVALGGVLGATFLPSQVDRTPMSPQEQEVVDRLEAIGVSAHGIGDPRSDSALGSAFPSRMFSVDGYGTAYVIFPHFVDGPPGIRVCASADNQGRFVFVNGEKTSSVNAAPWVYLIDPQYFIAVSDERTASMLQLGLGVTRAPC